MERWKGNKNLLHLPLLQTLLSSSSGPLESLSSSCRCKWLCWLKWWWFKPRLWCKWCRWLLLLLAADALKSRGLSGDGDRPPFSTRSRLKWSAAPTFAAPPPPRISVIIKRDRDGSTAIDPLCIGTVIVKPLAAAATPFGVKKCSAVLVIVEDFGLPPDECHWSTILIELLDTSYNWTVSSNISMLNFSMSSFNSTLFYWILRGQRFKTANTKSSHVSWRAENRSNFVWNGQNFLEIAINYHRSKWKMRFNSFKTLA